jgi:hypothetical protein
VKLGGSLIENTTISLPSRRLSIASSSDTTRFFANGSVNIGGAATDSTYKLNVNGGVKTDSIIVDNLYAKFGSYTGDGSVPFAPIEFRATSVNKARIDLRPASNGGWNSNWYGAITHNGTETDILFANYGSLYVGSSFWTAGSGIYLGNTRANPSMYIRNNSNVLIGDTVNTGFRFDVNGRARVRDTLTLSTTPVTADTSDNDLLVINSSNGQVRRFTGAFPSNYTASNGITLSGNNFKLGGTLTEFTTINSTGSTLVIGNPFGELIRIGSGNVLLRKLQGAGGSQDIELTTDSIYLRRINGSGDTSNISSTTTDTSKFKILTTNTKTGSLAVYTGAWYSVPLEGSATLDFPSTGHGNSADLTITVTGADEGDVVALGIPNASIVANASYIAWVSATNTVTVRFNNYASSGSSNPASGTFKIKVLK